MPLCHGLSDSPDNLCGVKLKPGLSDQDYLLQLPEMIGFDITILLASVMAAAAPIVLAAVGETKFIAGRLDIVKRYGSLCGCL